MTPINALNQASLCIRTLCGDHPDAKFTLGIIEQALQDHAQPALLGWRTADYLQETADQEVAKGWQVHFDMLPIFEGDRYTKLAAPATPAAANASQADHEEAMDDGRLYGMGFLVDGKRMDPKRVLVTLPPGLSLVKVKVIGDEHIDAICQPGRAARWKGDGRQYDRDTVKLVLEHLTKA
jgi:hypothetical protein